MKLFVIALLAGLSAAHIMDPHPPNSDHKHGLFQYNQQQTQYGTGPLVTCDYGVEKVKKGNSVFLLCNDGVTKYEIKCVAHNKWSIHDENCNKVQKPMPPVYKPMPPVHKPMPPVHKPMPPVHKPMPPVLKPLTPGPGFGQQPPHPGHKVSPIHQGPPQGPQGRPYYPSPSPRFNIYKFMLMKKLMGGGAGGMDFKDIIKYQHLLGGMQGGNGGGILSMMTNPMFQLLGDKNPFSSLLGGGSDDEDGKSGILSMLTNPMMGLFGGGNPILSLLSGLGDSSNIYHGGDDTEYNDLGSNYA
ncbi:uncharacterized protein LOC120335664 [Styela clava]